MGRVRFRGRDWVKSIFLDSNVDPGSTNYVDPGTCLTWQNHGDRQITEQFIYIYLPPPLSELLNSL